MKTELRVGKHHLRPGEPVVEIWHGDRFIGQVTADDNSAGVRVISKHRMFVAVDNDPLATAVLIKMECGDGR